MAANPPSDLTGIEVRCCSGGAQHPLPGGAALAAGHGIKARSLWCIVSEYATRGRWVAAARDGPRMVATVRAMAGGTLPARQFRLPGAVGRRRHSGAGLAVFAVAAVVAAAVVGGWCGVVLAVAGVAASLVWIARHGTRKAMTRRLRDHLAGLDQRGREMATESALLREINRRLMPRVEGIETAANVAAVIPDTAEALLDGIAEDCSAAAEIEELQSVFDRIEDCLAMPRQARLRELAVVLAGLDSRC